MTLDLRDPALAARAVTEALDLAPHPEGGWFRETWRDNPAGGRGVGTGILFLLAAGERSHWHRVDAVELWVWQAGAPLRLGIAGLDGRRMLILGPDLTAGETLQAVVPALAWQEAASLGAWSLVGCVVAPQEVLTHSGYVKLTNRKENRRDRRDRRLLRNQTGTRQCVVVIRQRGGRTVPSAFPKQSAATALSATMSQPAPRSWRVRPARGAPFRAATWSSGSTTSSPTRRTAPAQNGAESFFSQMRRTERGHHHHIAGTYLTGYAQ